MRDAKLETIVRREFDRAFAQGTEIRIREKIPMIANAAAIEAGVYDQMRAEGFKLSLVSGEYYLDRKVELKKIGPADHLFPNEADGVD